MCSDIVDADRGGRFAIRVRREGSLWGRLGSQIRPASTPQEQTSNYLHLDSGPLPRSPLSKPKRTSSADACLAR